MNKWADPKLIDQWDNTGFQLGNEDKHIKKILVSLDLDRKIADYAIDNNYDMIINHHPLIFKPIKSITTNNYKEKILYDLIRSDIVVFNAHTNLDRAEGGVSEELGRILGLKNMTSLSQVEEGQAAYGKVGEIETIELMKYVDFVKEKLYIDYLTIYGERDRKIKRVALCGGSGSDFIHDAYISGADVYITGDIKYHEAQLVDEYKITLIDAGHFHTEKVILAKIKEYLKENLDHKDLIIDICDKASPDYCIY